MIPISGLYETHLTVSDLDRSVTFYRDVVGLELAHTVPKRHAAFFWIGGRDRSMLGLWCIHSSPVFMRLHIAFSVTLDDVIRSVDALRSRGLTPRSGGGGPEIGSFSRGCPQRASTSMIRMVTPSSTSASCPTIRSPV